MKNPAAKIAIVLISLVLALYFHLGIYTRPDGMVENTEISADSSGNLFSRIGAVDIVGISRQIDFTAGGRGRDQINRLWDEFFTDGRLQSMVNWSEPQTVIAYYDEFAEDGSGGKLTLGFPEVNVAGPAAGYAAVSPAGGSYAHYPLGSPEAVDRKWTELMSEKRFPGAVIERYAFDILGRPREIQMQALFQ